MTDTITRRGFLGRSAAAGAGLAVVLPSPALAGPRTRSVWWLDPSRSRRPCGPDGCSSCHACEGHAHVIFARREDVRRAHTGCDCLLVEQPVVESKWIALFGHPSRMRATRADRRRRNVAAILGGS